MDVRTDSRLMISGDIDDVWEYLSDVGLWPQWAPTVRSCRLREPGVFRPGATVEQRAKGVLGMGYPRSQQVTLVDAPRRMAFAGPMGTSAARWGMDLQPAAGGTDANMWVEVDLAGAMRVIPAGMLHARMQRVSDREMAAIKQAVETRSRRSV